MNQEYKPRGMLMRSRAARIVGVGTVLAKGIMCRPLRDVEAVVIAGSDGDYHLWGELWGLAFAAAERRYDND